MSSSLSERAQLMREKEDVRHVTYAALDGKADKEPINLMYARNSLAYDLVSGKVNDLNLKMIGESCLALQLEHEREEFRTDLADLLNRRIGTRQKLLPENITLTYGVSDATDSLAHIIGDPGDCVLVPSPCYHGVADYLGNRAQLTMVHAPMDALRTSDGLLQYNISIQSLEQAFQDTVKKGKTVCAVHVINPNNPTGHILSKLEIQQLLQFSAKHQLHVVFNEIYALSVFEGDFCSLLHMDHIPDPDRTHWLWGVNKDLSMIAFRTGLCYSFNPEVVRRMRMLYSHRHYSAVLHSIIHQVVKDKEWLENVYFPTIHARLRESRDLACKWLTKLGIPHNVPRGAFFVWADFSKCLASETQEAELELFQKFCRNGVMIEPGTAYGCSPGYFRIVFSQHEITAAFERIAEVMVKDTVGPPLKATKGNPSY